jgi:hypothetical protein
LKAVWALNKMASFKDKLQVFFLGLLLGLLLGGGFFLFKLDQYVKELSIYKSFTRSSEQSISREERKEDPQNALNPAKSRPGNALYSNPPVPMKDSLALKAKLSRSRQTDDSLKVIDSLTNTKVVTADENIVLRKDELLSCQSFSFFRLTGCKNGRST